MALVATNAMCRCVGQTAPRREASLSGAIILLVRLPAPAPGGRRLSRVRFIINAEYRIPSNQRRLHSSQTIYCPLFARLHLITELFQIRLSTDNLR